MKPIDQTIIPGVGLGPLRLGLVDDDVQAIVGDPTEVRCVDYGDGEDTYVWNYEDLGVVLSFAAEDGFRLGSISTENAAAVLAGISIVGMTEDALLTTSFPEIGSPVLDEDFDESGRCYEWDDFGISCWVSDEDRRVVGVDIIPLYDETGDIPLWPEA